MINAPVGWLLFSFGCFTALSADQIFKSGPEKTSLIELYTSEGCSSCPPAERWLSERRDDPGLWKSIVPVAFHVTYWDSLGWVDKLAQTPFTKRQYAYAETWGSGSVYTPCFVRDGAEWRQRDGSPSRPTDSGKLQVSLDEKHRATVSFSPPNGATGSYDVWLALLGGEIENDVKRGENAGRKLRHDFTVIQLLNTRLNRDADRKVEAGTIDLPESRGEGTGRRSVAIWITPAAHLTPVIQATGGWLEP